MFCPNCGFQTDDNMHFCEQCGAALDSGEMRTEAETDIQVQVPLVQDTVFQGEKVTENIYLCPDGMYRWIYEFRMMKNPAILFTLFKIFGGDRAIQPPAILPSIETRPMVNISV